VVLLGDAAHPMMQYFAQGACMAMEDAVCLADCLDAEADVERALAAYRDRRVDRTSRVQLQSRLIGDHIYHPAGAHARLRNSLLGARTAEDWFDSLQWLYGGSGLAGGAAAVR
jgi:salicylate hydroxylase